MKRTLGLAVATIVVLLGSRASAQTDTKYAAALDALQELDSAASVGLNFRQFNERVITVKIKVDKLGNDPRYKLMKETTRLLVDSSTLWNGYVSGHLPMGSLQGLQQRNANDPWTAKYLTDMQSEDPGEGLSKQLWEINAKAAYQTLWLNAQKAMAEVLGKAPKGSYGKMMSEARKAYKEKEGQAQ